MRSLFVVTTLLATACVAVRDINHNVVNDLTLDPTSTWILEDVNVGARSLLQEETQGGEANAGPQDAAPSSEHDGTERTETMEFKYTVADACIADVSVYDETAKAHFVHSDYTAAVRCCALDGSVCTTKSRGDGECLPDDVTYRRAKETCEDIGWRLPRSIAELGSACGTGCLFDFKEIWYDASQEGVTEYRSSKQVAHQVKRVLLYGDTLRVGSFMTSVARGQGASTTDVNNTKQAHAFVPNRAPFYLETFAHKLQQQLNAWGLTACGAKVDFGGMPAYSGKNMVSSKVRDDERCVYKPQVHASNMETVCPGLISLMRKSHTAGTPYGYVMIMVGQADIQDAAVTKRVSIAEIIRDVKLLHSEVWNEGAKSFILTLPKFPEVLDFTEEQTKAVHELRIKVNHALTQMAQESDGKGILLDIDRVMDGLRSKENLFTNNELNRDGYQKVSELVGDMLASSGENINPCGQSTKRKETGFLASIFG